MAVFKGGLNLFEGGLNWPLTETYQLVYVQIILFRILCCSFQYDKFVCNATPAHSGGSEGQKIRGCNHSG